MATGCLHAIGIAIGVLDRGAWGRRAVRLAGGLIALTGALPSESGGSRMTRDAQPLRSLLALGFVAGAAWPGAADAHLPTVGLGPRL